MDEKAIARLICDLVESRDWANWKGKAVTTNTNLTDGQVRRGHRYLREKGYIKKDDSRIGKDWWIRAKKFVLWKMLLGKPETKLDAKTGKLVYARKIKI